MSRRLRERVSKEDNEEVSITTQNKERNDRVNLSVVPGTTAVMGIFMLLWPPLMVSFFWLSCDSYQCSLRSTASDLWLQYSRGSLFAFSRSKWPSNVTEALVLYSVWLVFQVVLYIFLPGTKSKGQATPAGHVLDYNCNGLLAWFVTHCAFILLVTEGLIRPSIIYNYWGPLLVAANLSGYFWTIFVFIKARVAPTHPDDRCFTGSFWYDFFMGVELNPRIRDFDFKLFFNGRPGIIAWTLINLSFAAKQYESLGYVTNSMVLLNILHATYVLDFFYNEDWYLRTIDIAHDHFGFYLAWGDSVWLPYMYTLQAFYLVQNPIWLPQWAVCAILLLGFAGYAIFRSVNHQKDHFRMKMKAKGECQVWGKPAKFVQAFYFTNDGQKRETQLLTSGWWGVSRHFNYVGDLMNSLSYCLTCGFTHVLPYFYIIYMTVLLVHRVFRDEVRCSEKYGKFWKLYTEKVPYRILPYVF